jgi:hypothetical protein
MLCHLQLLIVGREQLRYTFLDVPTGILFDQDDDEEVSQQLSRVILAIQYNDQRGKMEPLIQFLQITIRLRLFATIGRVLMVSAVKSRVTAVRMLMRRSLSANRELIERLADKHEYFVWMGQHDYVAARNGDRRRLDARRK